MKEPIIEVKNIGKKYGITHERGGYVSLRDVLMFTITSPFQFFKAKAKKITGFSQKEDFWALKNVNFSVERGEVIGVIGANGAGKSTLLKILSRITPPTEGEIILRGRVGSLLEVGTGFHPELSGRENIFLNGAILGMKKQEIAGKFNEIVEFAGIEKFLDTPVKHYSSGMYVRLAFSVAAHMEPDILIVDEVLAVGDAEFQKKCLGKMEEVTRTKGRTILFVSHNIAAIENLCGKTMLLNKGEVVFFGETKEAIRKYSETSLKNSSSFESAVKSGRKGNGNATITAIRLTDKSGKPVDYFSAGQDAFFEFDYTIKEPSIKEFEFILMIDNQANQNRIAHLSTKTLKKNIITKDKDKGTLYFSIKNLPLNVGTYTFSTWIEDRSVLFDWLPVAGSFTVMFGDYYTSGVLPPEKYGTYLLDYDVREK